MIKDEIIFKNKTILTIYHRGFEHEQDYKKRVVKEKIGRNWIIFNEECVSDSEWDLNKEYDWEESGLLMAGEKINPYNHSACANMIHRVYVNKSKVIEQLYNKASQNDVLGKVIDFVQKYTGMDLKESPIMLGDVFLFSIREINYKSNENNSILLYDLKAGMKIIIKFKKRNIILETRIINIDIDTDEIEVETDYDWNCHDIEIYMDESLIYIRKDVYYMRHIVLNMSMKNPAKKIPQSSTNSYYALEQSSKVNTIEMGEPLEEKRKRLNDLNRILCQAMHGSNKPNDVVFIKPGQEQIAREKIMSVLFDEGNELWLFDPYFTDTGSGDTKMIDWLRLIANAKAKKRHIVFYCSGEGRALDASQLETRIQRDSVIKRDIIEQKNSCIQLVQTRQPIHDRFLIIVKENTMKGISIGTSLNSLNANHYCIHDLDNYSCRMILEELSMWIESNIEEEKECGYDTK